jgi:hypothetical protein
VREEEEEADEEAGGVFFFFFGEPPLSVELVLPFFTGETFLPPTPLLR